jgi:hypothetical protein
MAIQGRYDPEAFERGLHGDGGGGLEREQGGSLTEVAVGLLVAAPGCEVRDEDADAAANDPPITAIRPSHNLS